MQKTKNIKERSLTSTIRSNNDQKRRNILQMDISENLKIFKTNRFNFHIYLNFQVFLIITDISKIFYKS